MAKSVKNSLVWVARTMSISVPSNSLRRSISLPLSIARRNAWKFPTGILFNPHVGVPTPWLVPPIPCWCWHLGIAKRPSEDGRPTGSPPLRGGKIRVRAVLDRDAKDFGPPRSLVHKYFHFSFDVYFFHPALRRAPPEEQGILQGKGARVSPGASLSRRFSSSLHSAERRGRT